MVGPLTVSQLGLARGIVISIVKLATVLEQWRYYGGGGWAEGGVHPPKQFGDGGHRAMLT